MLCSRQSFSSLDFVCTGPNSMANIGKGTHVVQYFSGLPHHPPNIQKSGLLSVEPTLSLQSQQSLGGAAPSTTSQRPSIGSNPNPLTNSRLVVKANVLKKPRANLLGSFTFRMFPTIWVGGESNRLPPKLPCSLTASRKS